MLSNEWQVPLEACLYRHFQNPLGNTCFPILEKMFWSPQSKYVDYWNCGMSEVLWFCTLRSWISLAYAVGDADEEYVQDFSFGFSYILRLLQQNSLSCFLKGFFFTLFVLKVSVLDSKISGKCSVCFLKKSMIVVVLEVEGLEVKKQHLESRCQNMEVPLLKPDALSDLSTEKPPMGHCQI